MVDKIEKERDEMQVVIKSLPMKVPVQQTMKNHKVVYHETERKLLLDEIKMVAYRVETALSEHVTPFSRHEDEARNFVKTLLAAKGDIIVDESTKTMTIKYYSMSNPMLNKCFASIVDRCSRAEICFPGTDMRLKFEFEASVA